MIATERVGPPCSAWCARRHEIDLSLGAGRDRDEPQLGVAGAAAVVDALIAFEALGPTRHPHHGVDDEAVHLIDVEQEVLAAFG
jgi:hypothetical protein